MPGKQPYRTYKALSFVYERCTAVIAKQAIKEYYSSSACSNVAFANLTS